MVLHSVEVIGEGAGGIDGEDRKSKMQRVAQTYKWAGGRDRWSPNPS
jgi:hypothetical protein